MRRWGPVARVVTVLAAGLVLLAVGLALVGLFSGGSPSPGGPRTGIPGDTARFSWGTRSVEVPLTACGREGDRVVMAGTEGGIVLQVGADVADGGETRTGVTVDLGADRAFGAFGADLPQGPVGEITRVAVVGDGLVVEGRWEGLDPDTLTPTTVPATTTGDGAGAGGPRPGDRDGSGEPGVDGELVARCAEDDDAPA